MFLIGFPGHVDGHSQPRRIVTLSSSSSQPRWGICGVAWSDGFPQHSQRPFPHCVPGTPRKAGTAYLNTAGSGHESENWGQDPAPLLWPDWLLPRCWTLWLTFTWLPLEQLWMLLRLNGVACPLSRTFHPDFKMPFLSFSVNPPKPYMCDPPGR